MPRSKRPHKQQRFDLYPDDPDEKLLCELLERLAKSGKQRDWIVKSLVDSLKKEFDKISN